ncbi:chaplin [Streptomyces sp. NPDC024017]|uniref:chaplin n=1 Tax=Streptomyces sp. NPDC024017 TaxID=3154326 RepID=UPI003403E437
MRQTLSRGMVAAAAATGILSLCGGAAFADTSADGVTKGSPGALSGNTVQAPVEVPVNACGNSVDVIAALNPSFGNSCANEADADGGDGEDRSRGDEDTSYDDEDTSYGDGGYGDDDGGYGYGDTPPTKPPHTPPTKPPHTPPTKPPHTPPPGGDQSTPPATPPGGHQTPPPPPGDQEQPPSLPETGAADLLGAAGASAALIVSGVVLYRRGRAASHR